MPRIVPQRQERPIEVEPIRFTTQDGQLLQGEIRFPQGEPRGAAVLCHPDPRHGGSKDHPLLWAIRNDLANRGYAVLAFNFRGVMGSEGSFGGGLDEVVDVWAAVGRAREAVPGSVFVCGWSFGAHVALRAVMEDDRVARLALVGIPLGGFDASLPGPPALPPLPGPNDLADLVIPVLLLAGSKDAFCPPDALERLGAGIPDATVTIVPGADHYFSKRERQAAMIVGGFADRR
jgi:alpha/beta superfamily hydrolase